MARSHHIIKLPDRQRGSVAIWFVLCLPVLLGCAALAVDLARLNLTQAELQNVADAAAVGGASSLTDPGALPFNWGAANSMATSVAKLNVANGHNITDATIEDGYWNIVTKSWVAVTTPDVQPVGYVPAIRATITIASGQNNGPLPLFFAPFLGKNIQTVSASAIAVIASPAAGTGMFPFVLNMPLFTNWWNNGPKIDPSTGKPYVFDITSSYFGGPAGYWTTFQSTNNSASFIAGLFTTGNTSSLGILDNTYIPTGLKASDFKNIPSYASVQSSPGYWKDVAVFVVNSIDYKSQLPIVAIGGLRILGTQGNGANTKILAQFLNDVPAPGTNPGTGIAPSYGAYTPPLLVQ